MTAKVWIVDDDRSIRWVLERALSQEGWQVRVFEDARAMLAQLPHEEPDTLITDMRMPGLDGLGLLARLQASHPQLPVIVMTAHSDLDSAVSSFQGGAFEYLPKPFDVDEAVTLVRRAVQHRREMAVAEQVDGEAAEMPEIIGESPAMQEVFRAIGRLSGSHITVLINGESGTGKERVAQALHRHSPRRAQPFIALNMAAIPRDLMESELFGHEKGSFSGATAQRNGRFEQAHGGTLFLDEIGDLPLDTQVRLLRVLQSKAVTRVGGTKTTPVDARIVAATHRDLAAEGAAGRFREDLFHRLAVGILNLPPLRERGADVAILVDHFMAQINTEGAGKPEAQSKILSKTAKDLLIAHSWPGNIRELYHTLLRAALWSRGSVIEAADIRAALLPVPAVSRSLLERPLVQGFDLEGFLDEIKTRYIRMALERCGGKKTAAARLLGFSNHQTLGNWMKRLGLEDAASD